MFEQKACVNVVRLSNDENEDVINDNKTSSKGKREGVAETKEAEAQSEESEAGTETETKEAEAQNEESEAGTETEKGESLDARKGKGINSDVERY
jgi:hypothetical protein